MTGPASAVGTVAGLVAAGAARLAAVSPAATTEASTLLAHAVGCDPARLIMVAHVTDEQRDRYAALLEERAAGRPLQHLTGIAWFRHTSVAVGPGVFIPRPETEVMTGWVIERLREVIAAGTEHPLVVEPCTGSGVIAKSISLEVPAARVIACELGESAHDRAVANLAGTGVEVRFGDLADAFDDLADHTVDVVVCNPPYIPLTAWESVPPLVRDHDPELALFSGDDGLTAMRRLVTVAARLLRAGGWFAAEHAEVQHESAPAVLLDHSGWDAVRDERDLAGRWRFVTARARSPRSHGSNALAGWAE